LAPALGRVYSFESTDEKLRGYLQRTATIGTIATDVADYFERLLKQESGNQKKIMDYFDKPAFYFETIASEFRLIENDSRPVIVPWDNDAVELLAELDSEKDPRALRRIFRGLRQYIVNVHSNKFSELPTYENNGLAVLADMNYYDARAGLTTDMAAEALFV
jgi:CRISPR-associated endonuclease/helicase Cas3